jgi:predicted Zn-dependent protease
MQNYFNGLADFLTAKLTGDEVFTLGYGGEDSDFVRFNESKIRQAGHVQQKHLSLDLIIGSRHATGVTTLSGVAEDDQSRLTELLADLRQKVPALPEDPHLLYATEVKSTEQHGANELPPAKDATGQILMAGAGRDLVGIYASGGIHSGFANSLGQRNWFSSFSFNLDWSFYHERDKAVKSGYAGFTWDPDELHRKVESAATQLEILKKDSVTIDPGRYRVYMAPAAAYDYLGMISWGGFGLKMHRTKQTVLLKMIEEGASLHPAVTIRENTKDGVAANFQSDGFLKPDGVTMIEGGAFKDCLVSPRSAKEFDVPNNGTNSMEAPESLDVAAGDIPEAEILKRLDKGVYINNVWYLNYSDRPACRITGMTRFACFWVEGGEIVAPLNVMRFDETLYRAFGENLIGLTQEREMILDAGTYGGRDTGSGRIPGALIEDFNFNL